MISKYFNPNKSFLSLKVLWLIVSFLVLAGLTTFVVICVNTELRIDFSSSGFNDFISIFRFPLGILTLIIPVVALLAANHRSEQTKEQIRVSNSQNIFQNYYKHLEEFIKYADPSLDKFELSARRIHRLFFPDAPQGNYVLDSGSIDKLEKKLSIILGDLRKGYDVKTCATDLNACRLQQIELVKLCEYLGVSKKVIDTYEMRVRNNVHPSYRNTIVEYFMSSVSTVALASSIARLIKKLAMFDTNYIPSDSIERTGMFNVQKYKIKSHNPNTELAQHIDKLLNIAA